MTIIELMEARLLPSKVCLACIEFFHLEFESFLPCFEMMEMELDIIADQDFPPEVEL